MRFVNSGESRNFPVDHQRHQDGRRTAWSKPMNDCWRFWTAHLHHHHSTEIGFGGQFAALFNHARIRLHGAQKQVWNGAEIRLPACDAFEPVLRTFELWCGRDLNCMSSTRAGQHICRGSLRNTECCWNEPSIADVQSAWLILPH